MKAVGVIVEYNPFHNGHLYHLQEARKQAKADVVIAIMSGNFLQRGEPAIIDKWSRTELALEGGADLVVELPVAFSVQPADYFARGGIGLLKQLRCEAICFGTETGTAKEYEEFAKQWLKNEDKLDNAFKRYKNDGSSYAAQMERISIEAGLNLPLHNSYPNMILGKAYAKENYRFYPPMELIPIKRKGSCYHEKDLNTNEFSSATSIRNILLKTNNVKNAESALPAFAVKKLKKAVLVDWEQFWPLLRYQIIVQPPDKLREI
ncbi:MAG: nucleotidyltransferase family protein, partial [Pisciglobus halotolerans]|nr:nucleotidyltransferase family protein [Pisciglobus halotolerans]